MSLRGEKNVDSGIPGNLSLLENSLHYVGGLILNLGDRVSVSVSFFVYTRFVKGGVHGYDVTLCHYNAQNSSNNISQSSQFDKVDV